MPLALDHVVLWVADPLKSVAFYESVVGLPGVRVDEFRAGAAPFPSVRVSEHTIVDLMPHTLAPKLDAIAGASDPAIARSAGHPVHHVCVAMDRAEYDALRGRLEAAGITPFGGLQQAFGARGFAPHTYYFHDLDGNVLEARYYA